MADIKIRLTIRGDAEILAANLRDADMAELQAAGFDEALYPIRQSVMRSTMCWTALVDGELACIFGVTWSGPDTGSPWMLGTPVVDRHSRVLVRRTPHYIAFMLQAFSNLRNFVHAENIASVRWLRRMGFTLAEPQPYGPRGALFHPFEMRA